MTPNQLTLFQLQNPKCSICGVEIPGAPLTRKYCSARCTAAASDRKRHEMARSLVLENDYCPEDPRLQKAIQLKRETETLGFKTIARMVKIGPSSVKRALVKAGLYRPHPKFNGKMRAGKGILSRRIKRLDAAIKRKRLAELRANCAGVLRAMRSGIGCGEACARLGADYHAIYAYLSQRRTYRLLKRKSTMVTQNSYKEAGWRSSLYPTEADFQARIEGALRSCAGIEVKRRHGVDSGWRPDLIVNGRCVIELKVEVRKKCIHALIGQLAIAANRLESAIVLGCVPDDCRLNPAAGMLSAAGYELVSESRLVPRLRELGVL